MGDVPTSFARATKAFCLRIHTNRLTQKMLIALGYSLLRRTGHTMPNQYNTLLQCARTSNNAHHFIAALEDIVTRYRHNFFGTTDQEFSPFEVVRRCWTGQGNSFYHDPATVHWVAQNSKGISAWVIVLIILGSLLVLGLVFYFMRRRYLAGKIGSALPG